jgi:hypothetical protein
MAKAYTTRPSSLYDIRDPVTAWSFDRAVYMFGSSFDADLKKAGKDAQSDSQANSRRQAVIAKWLGGKQQFKDPAGGGQGAVTSKGSGSVSL